MVNQETLAGKWNEVSGKLKEKWGMLTDDDLRAFNGNVDQLVGRIQRRTGEAREVIEEFLGDAAEEASHTAAHLRDKVQQGAAQMAETARQGYESLREGYSEAERTVQERPGQSMAFAFGLGMLAGVGLSLLLRDRSSESTSRSHAVSEVGRQLRDALSSFMPNR